MAGSGSILGNAVLRLEDPTLLTGEGKYVDDIVEPGMLHVSYVRSTVAHANVVSVDIREAATMPGVVAVYHGAGDDLGLPSFQSFPMMPASLNRPIFATGKVRFVGDIVAAVVAETKSQAGDAAFAHDLLNSGQPPLSGVGKPEPGAHGAREQAGGARAAKPALGLG